ncbi:MAG: cupredoxin family copper-binding protein [Nitrososphaera sp.]
MAPEPKKDDAQKGGYSPDMKTVGLAILAMGISLLLVIIAWMAIGVDPDYSAEVMQEQQASLREQYGLPPEETLTAAQLETPPSLRGLENATDNATSLATSSNATGSNQTTTIVGNQTAAGNATGIGNQTSAAPGNQTNQTAATGNATAAAPAGGTAAVSIVQGASSKTNDAYNPNPAQISAGSAVTWTNDDSVPHTATSGQNATPDGTFDSGILQQGASFSFTFEEAGEYPYFCTLHPNMVGTISVS